jgi:hypothetical protein
MQRSELQSTLAERHSLSPIEAEELCSLLTEMLQFRFTRSKQLSNHIVNHRLGHQYPNISGIVRMEQEGQEWDFPGGFSRRMYAIICTELGLGHEGTTAKPVGFTPFKDLYSDGSQP